MQVGGPNSKDATLEDSAADFGRALAFSFPPCSAMALDCSRYVMPLLASGGAYTQCRSRNPAGRAGPGFSAAQALAPARLVSLIGCGRCIHQGGASDLLLLSCHCFDRRQPWHTEAKQPLPGFWVSIVCFEGVAKESYQEGLEHKLIAPAG